MSMSAGPVEVLSERVVIVLLPVTIIAFVMASSSVSWAMTIGRPLRWTMLFLFAGAALAYGLAGARVVSHWFVGAVAALSLVALLSSFWSVTPRLTFERAVSFAVVMAAVIALGAGAVHARERIERLFVGVIVAVDAVAIAGLVLLAVDSRLSTQAAGPAMPSRFRGFGQNPNTASMLFALAIPLALWLALSARRARVRTAAVLSALVLYGEIMASGSRGALLASAFASLIFLALAIRPLRRVVAAEALALVFFVVTFQIAGHRSSLAPPVVVPPLAAASRGATAKSNSHPSGRGGSESRTPKPRIPGLSSPSAPPPSIAPPTSPLAVGVRPTLKKSDVPIPFVPRQDEIGDPLLYMYKPILGYGSGRVFAWLTAIRQGLRRPVVGYGFGTEATVFVDRFYLFQGAYTENSFAGMFLQLGIVGTILLLLPFILVGRAVYLVTRGSVGKEDRTIVAAAASVVGGGFVVAFFQSYLYSVGNVATVTFWLSAAIATAGASLVRSAA